MELWFKTHSSAKLLFMHKYYLYLLGAFLLLNGCGGDYLEDFPIPPASTVPAFSFEVDNEGFAPATISIVNESIIPEMAGEYSFQWFFGDGTSSSEENPSHTYQDAGRYTVKLIITTKRGIEELSKSVVIQNASAAGIQLFFGDRNGESVQQVLINELEAVNTPIVGEGITRPYGLATDTVNNYLYIADFATGIIYRSDLAGDNLSVFRENIAGPTSLVYNHNTSTLYWATDDGIQKTSTSVDNVTDYQTLIDEQTDDPEGMTMDFANNKIYWVTYDGGLWSMNAGGTNAQEIIPDVLGAAVLVVGDKLYYHSYNLDTEAHNLKVSDLNGGQINTISSGMDGDIYGLIYEPEAQKIYWTDQRRGSIVRSNLDGSEVETFFQDQTLRLYGLALGKFQN